MAGSVRKFTATGVDRGHTLAVFLAARLGVTGAVAAKLVRSGATYVDRRRTEDPDQVLDAAQRITVHLGPGTAGSGVAQRPRGPEEGPPHRGHPPDLALSNERHSASGSSSSDLVQVCYSDRDALVVDKPAGVPAQAVRGTALGALDRLVQEREPAARLVHRLDQGASGLVLFSRTATARRRFARLLERCTLTRRYVAVAAGHVVPDQGCIDIPIGPDPRDRRRMAAGSGRPAQTRFRVVRRGRTATGQRSTLVELELVTGRTHQIRVHMAHAGHTLLGDAKYLDLPRGSPEAAPRLCLHATTLAWARVRVCSPAPAIFDELVLL